jgi:hypothetical protein
MTTDRHRPLPPTAPAAGPAAPAAARAGGPRKPWQRPRILSREPLEAIATVCAPSPPAKGNPGTCPEGPISS